jgi:hypothetical protein
LSGWNKIITGAISYKKLLKGIRRILTSSPSTLADQIACALRAGGRPVALILAEGDATAIAAEAEWRSPSFAGLAEPVRIETDSHTFARPGDLDALIAACRASLERLRDRA